MACAFGWIALLTYEPTDWPSPVRWPAGLPVHNAAGRVGAWLAYQLIRYFGDGAYPLVLFATVASIARIARPGLADWPFRLIGLALLMAVTAASVALIAPAPTHGRPEGRAGVLGVAVLWALQRYFSTAGTALILLCGFIVGVLLTADDLVLRVPTLYHNVRGWLARVRAVLRWIGWPRWSALAVATSRNSAGTPDGPSTADSPRATGSRETTARRLSVPPTLIAGSLASPGTDATGAAVPSAASSDRESRDDRPGGDDVTAPAREAVVRTTIIGPRERKQPPNPWPREMGDYRLPPLSLLRDPDYTHVVAQEGPVREKARILEQTLREFRIDARVVAIDAGPVITMFEVELAPGIKSGQISALSNDVARALRAPVVRVVPTLPGKNTIGIEVPNVDKEKVRLKELITLGGVRPTKMHLPIFIGKDASGSPLIADVTTMPHLLIAGTTGSGKSVCINTLIMSILMTQRPDHVKLILVDPKMVELSVFKDVPHLMCPIVTEMPRAELILDWAATKMDERYELLAEAGVKNIDGFNRLGKDEIYARFQPTTEQERAQIPTHLPYIVIIIDELADLMMTSGKAVEHHLARLAQKSRAVGIHLLVATQRPQANVVTGLIKSNLPSRIAFRVASRMDSRIVLDQNGAELLMGQGDMLFLPPGQHKLVRAQGTCVEDDEIKAVIDDLRSKAQPEFHHELMRLSTPRDDDTGERDPLFDQAVDIIVETQRGSVSLLQRRLEIGYSRASRLIDQMAAAGIVGEYRGSQARDVCVTQDEWAAIKAQRASSCDDRAGGSHDDAESSAALRDADRDDPLDDD
ncbi:MAG: DNA translocase FtsK [Phycisphaerae bacterium]|nr:DNA translocase FtsK [Phycisphaerae bacterium]